MIPKKLRDKIEEMASERFDVTDLGDGSSCYYGYVTGATAALELVLPLIEIAKQHDENYCDIDKLCGPCRKIKEVLGDE